MSQRILLGWLITSVLLSVFQAYSQEFTEQMAFDWMKKGQQYNTEAEKWQHWCRGDKKMNLPELASLTATVWQETGKQ